MDDPREGKSYRSRRMYMEAKEIHSDKAAQMKELERYAQELTSDIVEMIEDASPEEKQYLSKKIRVHNCLQQFPDIFERVDFLRLISFEKQPLGLL
jgi:hypothetical protein